MAFGDQGQYYKDLVWVPENDSRFKKVIKFNNKNVTGFYSFANSSIQNIWVDGVGHMSCAFYAAANKSLGDFYSQQMDSLLVLRSINKQLGYALPFTANTTGGYDWVDINKGFSSACAWYIFTKYGFNPFTLEENNVTDVHEHQQGQLNHDFKIYQNYPNPFNPTTKISWQSPEAVIRQLKFLMCSGMKSPQSLMAINQQVLTKLNLILPSRIASITSKRCLFLSVKSFRSRIKFEQVFIQTKKMILLR